MRQFRLVTGRRVFPIGVYLGAGVVITIMVALILASLLPVTRPDDAWKDSGLVWPRTAPDGWSTTPSSVKVLRQQGRTVELAAGRRSDGDHYVCASMGMYSFGWPCRALSTTTLFECPPVGTTQARSWYVGGLVAPSWAPSDMPWRLLPTTMIWPGIIADSITYGAIFAAVHLFARAMRSELRRRNDRCTRCGYLLRGAATCPECGKVSATRSNRRAPDRTLSAAD